MKGKRKCENLNNKPPISDNLCGNDNWNGDFGNVPKNNSLQDDGCKIQLLFMIIACRLMVWVMLEAVLYWTLNPLVYVCHAFAEEDSGGFGIFVGGSSFGSCNGPRFLPDDRYDCLFRQSGSVETQGESSAATASRSMRHCNIQPMAAGDGIMYHVDGGDFVENCVIMEYLVNISKRRAFWSLNEDILKITILKTNTPYPSRKIRRIHACTHQRPKGKRSMRRTTKKSQITRIEDLEVMTDKGKKSSMKTFVPNDKADYYFGITSITINEKNAYELKGKILGDLHNNAFNGTNGKDAVEHIEYYLKIIDPIELPNVDHDKLRVVVFPISLAGGARRWFDRTKESITCWVDLTAKFFGKYYPPSRIEGNNTPSNTEETTEIFKIKTDVFYYETPLCLAFNEFNYILKVDPDLLTKDIMGFKTYEDYKDDWIYEWNENVPWVYDKPWLDNGIWKEPKPVKHTCKPFNYKTGCSEWPTCSWREDGYYNGGNLPRAYHIGNSLHYQDLEWYKALEDSELKDEALRNKAIMEGEYENETREEGHELCGIKTREVQLCQIKRYKMIKYSFNDEEEYVVVKQDEYNDLTITSDEVCRAYQEIFWMMDEGWMVTRTE
ncbi:hypothetical protein Tco_0620049 [Tanacetum coccineum]